MRTRSLYRASLSDVKYWADQTRPVNAATITVPIMSSVAPESLASAPITEAVSAPTYPAPAAGYGASQSRIRRLQAIAATIAASAAM